ncbi:hypothetical protein CROQUDRAFT_671576 [Cronartium quercuum f. sp. fusiforme G11]|uniref:Formamidase n=1 Tax=Cronartium quercuum f. sp. fusiforme G11 TaxID=708437 RepID=A0A9P6TBK4_9BASI|nr:hypothetical protein CROQUDRAFT_671576 [Cronartium quercuum f. sp. fusiforme G11]
MAHRTIISVDPLKPANEQIGLHNRWHPDIPPFVTVTPGEVVKVECVDWTGAIHNLSGPIRVEGAQPGDALLVEILDVRPFDHCQWGYTGIFELENGGGLFARDFKSRAAKAIWDFEGIYATSRHIPGVRFAGTSHPGLMGTAPSKELLTTWNQRETTLVSAHATSVPPVAFLPEPKGCHVGSNTKLAPDVLHKIGKEGARTIPGREHGGNVDIKNLSRGSKCYFPVYVDGANLSLGDLHFSQGDGEMSFCGAIEMAGVVTLKMSVIMNGIEHFALKQPIFLPSPIDPLYASQIVFQGLSFDLHADGRQYSMDATIAYKQAALNCIAYLQKLGYTREQAYLLLSAAPIQAHLAAIVDSPNACVTIGLPTEIFEENILPKEGGLSKRYYGQCAIRSDGVV